MRFPDELLRQLAAARIVATLSVDRAADAAPIAQALFDGGIRAVELLLRTPAAIDAAKSIRDAVPEMLLGVGTILTPDQVASAQMAGADFGVAPGLNRRVLEAADDLGLPFAPGLATPSELEAALELGCRFVKLFPAEALGGIEYLRAMAAPYKHLGVKFMPLGGLKLSNVGDYLHEPSVIAAGGSWIVERKCVIEGDWDSIRRAAEEAMTVTQQHDPSREAGR